MTASREAVGWRAELVLLLGGLFFGACRSAHEERIGVAVLPEASTEPGAMTAADAAPPLPPDLDVKALEQQLQCPKGGRRYGDACRILREFGAATRGIGQVPSGEGRWMGKSYHVEHGAEQRELVVLAASNVPAATVGPTDLPLRVAMGELPKDKRRDGEKLARALVHGDAVSNTNKALPFVKSWTSANGRIAMASDGPSVRLITEGATYVRLSGQKVLLVALKPAVPGVVSPPGDGTYAELWPVSW